MYRGTRGYPDAKGSFVGHESLEDDNTRMEDELKGKIGALKSLSIDIGHEVREHNRLLNSVDNDFDSVQGLLSNSIGRILRLAKSGSRHHIAYLLLFCLAVFIVLWWIV